MIKSGYNAELDELKDIASNSRQWIANFQQKEKERSGIKSLKVGYNKVFGYYIEVTNANSSQVPDDYIRKQTMIDPVNNFKIPEEWIARTGLAREELETKVASGMIVVLSDGSILKRGYTTGTTASAAAKAAVLSLKKTVDNVSVPTPVGLIAQLEVSEASQGRAIVKKIPNDHESDITRGLDFVGEAREAEGIRILGGKGIGIVRRDGLQVPKGQPAINPKPMEQIKAAVQEAVEELGLRGAEVTISIPDGERIGKETLNSRIGVEGGISVLGSTGFVEPWARGLDGYDVAFTRRRSWIRIPAGPLSFL